MAVTIAVTDTEKLSRIVAENLALGETTDRKF